MTGYMIDIIERDGQVRALEVRTHLREYLGEIVPVLPDNQDAETTVAYGDMSHPAWRAWDGSGWVGDAINVYLGDDQVTMLAARLDDAATARSETIR